MTESKPQLVTYYNGACPVCRAGIEGMRDKHAGDDAFDWLDIAADPAILEPLGLKHDDVKKRLHVADSTGRFHIGVDAAIQLWMADPRTKWRAKLVATPGIYHLSCFYYDRILAPLLFRWNRWNGR